MSYHTAKVTEKQRDQTDYQETHLLGPSGSYKRQDVRWHAQAGGRHVAKADSILGEQAGQGVYCASMLEIPYHCDLGKRARPLHWEVTPATGALSKTLPAS